MGSLQTGVNAEESTQSTFDALVQRADKRFQWHWQQTIVAGTETRIAVASDPDGMLIEACRRQDEG